MSMSLVAIKEHMKLVKIATLSSLSLLFKTDADTVRCMMQHWIKKGCVRECLKTPACGSTCFKCPAKLTEMYEWVYN